MCLRRLIMDARVKPAHDAENVARASISDSTVKQPSAIARVLDVGPG
jgi:hypothetical protein